MPEQRRFSLEDNPAEFVYGVTVLELKRLSAVGVISEAALMDCHVREDFIGGLVLQLSRKIAHWQGTSILRFPKTWWDHVKERFIWNTRAKNTKLGQWFLRRSPIEYIEHQAEAYLWDLRIPDKCQDVRFNWVVEAPKPKAPPK